MEAILISKLSSNLVIEKTTLYYKLIRKLAFPTTSLIILALFSINLIGSIVAFFLSEGNLLSLLNGIHFGLFALSFPSLVSDLFSHHFILRKDPLFSLRRCYALSLFSCTIWIFTLLLGFILKFFVPSFTMLEDPFYLGLFIILPLRFMSIISISESNLLGKISFSMLQPLICIISGTYFFEISLTYALFLFILSATLSFVIAYFLMHHIETLGLRRIGASATEAFRAFLVAWLDRNNDMFEKILDGLGIKRNISITALQFRSKSSKKQKGIMVVSNFHPGPFMNVGSSILPYMIQNYFEKKTNAIISVPHGISGHEGNLVTQKENGKVIEAIEEIISDVNFSGYASPFISTCSTQGFAKANCQVFKDSALITLTQSPEDMEDIPLDVGSALSKEAKKYFNQVAIIDAHNSITRIRPYSEEELQDYKESAFRAIEKASQSKTHKFRFGSAKRVIRDFSLKDGFGPGGIIAFLVEVNGRLAAYVTIDGNNMVSGLRERILKSLKEMGIEHGEVMTTDTHMVNGIVSAKLGYHPVGEVVDEALLISNIKSAIKEAMKNLEEAETAIGSNDINVKSLGSDMFNRLTAFMYEAAKLILAYIMVSISGLLIIGIVLLR